MPDPSTLVPTLDDCRALDEALREVGLPPMETVFWHVHRKGGWMLMLANERLMVSQFDAYPAPTLEEVLARLGEANVYAGARDGFEVEMEHVPGFLEKNQSGVTAACRLLIRLLKEGYLTPETQTP